MNQLLIFLMINWFAFFPQDTVQQQKDCSSFMSEIEIGTWKAVNEYRKENGLPELIANEQLTEIARQHSKNLAAGKAQAHDGIKGRIEQVKKQFQLYSFSENVLYLGGIPIEQIPEEATKEWATSPSHQKAMVGNWNKTGMGVAISKDGTYYFTQLFVLD